MQPVMQLKSRPGALSAGVVFMGPRTTTVERLRGEVQEFTSSSRSRLLSWLSCAKPSYRIMVTLTVPHVETDGALFKRKLDRFLDYAMRAAPAGASITWFLEFQHRGAPHVHLLTNFRIRKEWVSAVWPRMWKDRLMELFGVSEGLGTHTVMERTSTRCEWLRSSAVMKRYAVKYSAKTDQKSVPENYEHVGRFWGIRGCRDRVAAATWRKQCHGGFWGFPGDVVRLFWIAFKAKIEGIKEIRIVQWQKGVGVSVFFPDWMQRQMDGIVARLVEEFDFEGVGYA